MKLFKLAPILIATIIFQSCSTTSGVMKEKISGSYTLATMNENPINRMVAVPTLEIDAEGMRIFGNAGCNSYNGPIESLNSEKFLVSDKIATTMMACNKENIETDYLQNLATAEKYEVKDSTLKLYNKSGKNILSFIKNTNVANHRLHDIWLTATIDTNPINRMVMAPRLEIDLTEMKIFGNDGCNEFNGTIVNAASSSIKFGQISSTRKMCENMEITNKFNAALTKVATYKLDGLNLFLMDSDGKEVLSLIKGD